MKMNRRSFGQRVAGLLAGGTLVKGGEKKRDVPFMERMTKVRCVRAEPSAQYREVFGDDLQYLPTVEFVCATVGGEIKVGDVTPIYDGDGDMRYPGEWKVLSITKL